MCAWSEWCGRGLTFELRGRQRWDARARLAKMYRVPLTGPAWPAVGAPFERGVRPQCDEAEHAELRTLIPLGQLLQSLRRPHYPGDSRGIEYFPRIVAWIGNTTASTN